MQPGKCKLRLSSQAAQPQSAVDVALFRVLMQALQPGPVDLGWDARCSRLCRQTYNFFVRESACLAYREVMRHNELMVVKWSEMSAERHYCVYGHNYSKQHAGVLTSVSGTVLHTEL